MQTSAEWGELRKERPDLALELLEAVTTILRRERDTAERMRDKALDKLGEPNMQIADKWEELSNVWRRR